MAPQRHRATLPILFSVIVIDLIGFGIVLPVLPFYADAFGASALVLGLLLTSHAAMQSLFAPLWGRLADRIGRRPVMLGTIAGTGASLVVLGLAESLVWLFVARLLSGAFAANISVATAYIGDVTEDDERTRWMGMVGACFGVGFLVGPALGGWLANYGYGVPMFFAAGLAGVNLVYAAVVLKEPEVHRGLESSEPRLRVLANPVVRNLCITYFLFCLAVAQLETVFAYFMMDSFGYDAPHVAMILVLMAAVMVAIQGGAIRRLVDRYGERRLLGFGVGLMAVSFAVIPWLDLVPVLLVPLVASSIGRAVSQPSMMGLVSFEASATTRGAVMGTFQASASAARVIGPVVAGLLYDRAQPAPFLLASGLLAFALLASSRAPRGAAETEATA